MEQRQHPGQEIGADGGNHPHRHRKAQRFALTVRQMLEFLHLHDNLAGLLQHLRTHRRDQDPLVVPFEDLQPQLLFQFIQRRTQRRLTDVAQLRRLFEMQGFFYCQRIGQLLDGYHAVAASRPVLISILDCSRHFRKLH